MPQSIGFFLEISSKKIVSLEEYDIQGVINKTVPKFSIFFSILAAVSSSSTGDRPWLSTRDISTRDRP